MDALLCADLAVGRRGVRLLEGITLPHRPGSAIIVRGANGIGKTTLLRTLAGLQPALAGHVIPTSDQFAYITHTNALKAALSVQETLDFWCALYASTPQHRAATVADFELAALEHRQIGHLSQGQQRRLGLARLCLTDRPIWCMDEPASALDEAAAELLTRAIERHLASGGAAVISTHQAIDISAESLDLGTYIARETSLEDGF